MPNSLGRMFVSGQGMNFIVSGLGVSSMVMKMFLTNWRVCDFFTDDKKELIYEGMKDQRKAKVNSYSILHDRDIRVVECL